jgi:threonine dehydratase
MTAKTNIAPHASHRLSLERIAEAAHVIDPVFTGTPQYRADALSGALGFTLTLKVETLNPVRSFKGRGAEFLMQRRVATGERRPLVCASAGNFGQALAYAARKHGIACTVFAARGANGLKLDRMRALGAAVRLAGEDFDAAKDAARVFAATQGITMIEDGREAEIAEGAGTIALELLARGDAFDTVAIPLGNGALLTGMARWLKAHAPATRVIGVCSAGADVMARAWRRDHDTACADATHRLSRTADTDANGRPGRLAGTPTDTIADGIAVRVPVPEAVRDLRGLVDDVVRVDDDALIDAMRRLHAHAGLVVEPAGAAGLAALIAARERYAGQHVATVLCGGNVTREQALAWRLVDGAA